MITDFKIFENIKQPEIADYVIMEETELENSTDWDRKKFFGFLSNNIGQIIKLDYDKYEKNITVKYTNIPYNINYYFDYYNYEKNEDGERKFNLNKIKEISKTVEDLEAILAAKKYNL